MKKNLSFIVFFLLTCLVSHPGLFGQKGPNPGEEPSPAKKKLFKDRLVDIRSASPVTTLGKDELEQSYRLPSRSLEHIVRLTPQQQVLKSTETHISIRGLGSSPQTYNNSTLYGHNPNPFAAHSQTVITDMNQVPLSAIEQVEVLKGPTGTLYGPNTVSGVMNFITRTDLNARWEGNRYNPYYTGISQDLSGITNPYLSDWKNTVNGYLNRGSYTDTKPDLTYGVNGELRIQLNPVNDYWVETKEFYDCNKILRQKTNFEVYPEYYGAEETQYFDLQGQLDFSKLKLIDQGGYSFDLMQNDYNKGVPNFGYFIPAPNLSSEFRQYYDPAQNQFLPNASLGGPLVKDKIFWNYNFQPSKSSCLPAPKTQTKDDYPHHVLTGSISIRLEDFGNDKETFIGGSASYTYFFQNWIGATVDLSTHCKKINDVKYSVLNAYVGPTFVPFTNSHGLADPFTISAHTLIGYNHVKQKYQGNSFTDGNLSLKLGLALDWNFKEKIGIRFGADDYMVLGDGNTTNNLGFSLGARFSF